MNEIYDSVVIGAGPAGITAAIYLKRAGLKVCIVEKETPGGQLNKTSIIENYPGIKHITGPDLAYNLYEQIRAYDIEYKYGEVRNIIVNNEYKTVNAQDEEIKTKSIIIAVGRNPKKLENNLGEDLIGKGVSYCALCDGALYKNEEVAIIGGGNSALEESLYLSEICKKVYIINRSEKLRGDDSLINKIKEKNNIEIMLNKQVSEFIKEDNKLSSLRLKVKDNDQEEILKVKGCFIFIGYEPSTNFLKKLDILDEKGYIIVDERGETSIKGIYAAGDILKKEAYQIVTAASDGALSAVACIKDLNR